MSELNKNQKIIIYIILTLIVLVIIYYIWIITHEDEETIVQEYNEIENNEYAISNVTNEIIVHVAGAVENEGIQKLPENSRIADAIEAAGGLTKDANSKSINLAQKISDGQKIYIPNNNEEIPENHNKDNIEEPQISTNTAESELVNINTATRNRTRDVTRNRSIYSK